MVYSSYRMAVLLFPLYSSATDFNRLDLDPRPVQQHLDTIRLGPSPDVVIGQWKDYIHRMYE
jgi:hypothetical protein